MKIQNKYYCDYLELSWQHQKFWLIQTKGRSHCRPIRYHSEKTLKVMESSPLCFCFTCTVWIVSTAGRKRNERVTLKEQNWYQWGSVYFSIILKKISYYMNMPFKAWVINFKINIAELQVQGSDFKRLQEYKIDSKVHINITGLLSCNAKCSLHFSKMLHELPCNEEAKQLRAWMHNRHGD